MIKLAILSNINIDPLKNELQKNDFLELYFSGFNRWQSDLLDVSSDLYAFSPQYVFIHLDAGEYKENPEAFLASVETYFRRVPQTRFIISNFNFPPYSVATYSEKNTEINSLNAALDEFSQRNKNVFVLDFNRLILWNGYKNLFDDKYWYLGRIKFSNLGFRVLADEVKNVLTCLLGKTKKVLILDLDNTLWGGILGETDEQNIQLSQEGIGLIFVDFQKKIKQLKEMGILLVSCSKNNEADAKEMFEKNPNMHLKWDDFILHKINWRQKTDNIAEIAESLQLGLDSMVFIDDNRRERELVKQTFPQIETPDFPEDISVLNPWFVMNVVYPFFPKKQLTDEDKEKTVQYQRNISRNEIQKTLSYEEFIASLQIRLTISEPNDSQFFRVAQLTQKTNQFNLTGKRYSETDISTMNSDSRFSIYICEYEDKFGKEGIIGCAIIKTENEKATVDTFLLSCRVLGRNVENDFMKHIIMKIKDKGIKKVEGIYNKTDKNIVAKDFYIKNGFISDDEKHYFLENF
ncbi:MAG: HAD-IIIC family phosphatase [Flavobacteriaceae bacterium]|jgi:FkbH-like protein|nr:HAD-IIIC family phosphatase [Flavobacteriaceae bacterium]